MAHSRSAKKAARTRKAKSAIERANVKPLSAKEMKALADKDSALPDLPVRRVLEEAGELASTARTKADDLLSNSKLKKGFDKQLHAAQDMLHRAEQVWSEARNRSASGELIAARKAAEALKTEAMNALRYFKKDDQSVQDRLDQIAEGTGDVDLIDDLRKLAALASEHTADLKKAKKLPPKPVTQLNKLADNLSAALAESNAQKSEDQDQGDEAIDIRNRAYWNLRSIMDEVSAAGRYVFGGDKRALKQFRTASTRIKKSGGGSSSGGKGRGKQEPAPT